MAKVNILSTTEKMRKNFPDVFGQKTDDEIIGFLSRKYPNYDWGDYGQPDNQSPAATQQEDIDDSPSAISNLLLWNANEALADDYDWAKRAYNNSLSGSAYKMLYGKEKYQVEDVPNEWWQDAAGFFLGMTNPLEMGLFVGTGGVGQRLGAKAAEKLFYEGAKEGVKKFSIGKARDKAAASWMMKKGGLEGAFGLGTYSGAAGTIQRYGQQHVDITEGRRDDFDHLEVMKGVASDFGHGAALGALGGIVKAPMARKFAKASKTAEKLKARGIRVPSSIAAKKILNSPVGQVVAESQAFTAGQTFEEAIATGEIANMDEWWRKSFSNAAIIGGMRAGSKVYKGVFKNDWTNDVDRYYAARKKLYTDAGVYDNLKRGSNPKESSLEQESLEKVQESLGEKTPKEVLDRLTEIEAEKYYGGQEKSAVKKKIKRLRKLDEKATNKDGEIDLNKLTEKERGEWGELEASLNAWKVDFYEKLKGKDYNVALEMYKEQVGGKADNTQRKMIEGIIDGQIKNAVLRSEIYNKVFTKQKFDKKAPTEDVVGVSKKTTDFDKLFGNELIRKVSDLSGRSFEEIRNEFTFERSTTLGKEKVLNESKLREYGKGLGEKTSEVIFEKIKTPDETIEKYKGKSGQEPIEDKAIQIANKLDKDKIKFKYDDASKINESYYDINDIALNFFPERKAKKGGRAKTGALVEPKTDIGYIDVYNNFAKSLSKKGKSLRDATWEDVTSFVTQNPGSKHGLAIFYKRLNNKGLIKDGQLKGNLEEITNLGTKIPEKPQQGLRTEDISLKESRIKYIQSKTYGEKGIPISTKLKNLISSILPKSNEVNVIFRSIDGLSLLGSNLKQYVKKYYGGDATPKDLRSALSQYVATKYGVKSNEWAIIDAVGLAHKQAKGTKEQRAYIKDVKLDKEFTKLRDEFINLIEGTSKLPSEYTGRYKEGGLTIEQLRKGLSKMLADNKGDIKIGNKSINQNTKEALMRFMLETSPRPQDVIPPTSKDIIYIKPERVKQRAITARPKGETVFKGKDVEVARSKFLKDVAKKNKLTEKELKEAGLDKDVMGEFAEGEIKLKRGEWQPSDFYHENLHRLKAFANATGNKKLSKLIQRGEKLGKTSKEYKEWKKKNPNRDMEEFLADVVGGKASKIQFSKGVLPKIKQFVKQLVSQMKVAFGQGNFKDISRVLAGKVRKGFTTEGVKFGEGVKQRKLDQVETVKNLGLEREQADATRKGLLRQFNKMMKEGGVESTSGKNIIKEFIQERMGIENFPGLESTGKNKKLIQEQLDLSPREYYEKLKKFESELNRMNPSKIKRIESKTKWFKELKTVDSMRVNKNFTDAKQKQLLESWGVKNGDIWNTSLKEIKKYKELLHTINEKESSGMPWVDELNAVRIMNQKGDKAYKSDLNKLKTEIPRAIYPVYKVLEASGLKPLAKMLKDHFSAEAGHLGITHDLMINEIQRGWKSNIDSNGNKLKGGQTVDVPGIGVRKYNKIKDVLWSIDHKGQRILENIDFLKNNKELFKGSKGKKYIKEINNAEAFFRKAFKPEFFNLKNKDGKLIGGNLKKYINYKTPEGRVVERHVKSMKYFEEMMDLMLQKNMNEAQYERFMKQGNIKWIRDGIFLTRQVTKDFKQLVDLNSKAIRDIVDVNAMIEAKKLAKERFKTETPTNKELGEVMPEARSLALESIHDASNFSLDKISSKSLMTRGAKLPEFLKDPNTGKLIRTYETTFDATTKRYAIGMSKFLATMEFAPDFAKIKGFKKTGAKELLGSLRLKDSASADWVKEVVNMRIGVGESNPFEVMTGAVQIGANVLAKVGLSAPTSGFKNIITGTVGTGYAFKLQDMGRSFADILRGESRLTTKRGHESLGMQHFSEGQVTEIFDKTFFRTGLMKPTEKFNRNLAILASKYDQRRMFQNIKDFKKGTKQYDRAYERLKDFYELTPEQVKLVKKYGFNTDNVLRENFKSNRDFLIEKRELQNAFQKMDTMAHVKTQGSSAEIFMPKFASGQYIRPLTLYKRMAYAATVNTAENVRRAWKSRDFSKILVGTAATYVGGSALMGAYWHLLGQPMPKENDPRWKKILTTMWKGEFLGLFSEYLSPYDSSINNSFQPAIFDNLASMYLAFDSVKEGKKRVLGRGQAGDTYLRKTFAIYNTAMKVVEKRNNPYNRDMLRMKALYRDYEQDVLKEPSATFEGNELTKYKIDLRNAFNLGTDEEFVKTYMVLRYALASDYMKRGYADTPRKGLVERIKSPEHALKKADTKLKTMMKNLNPNPAYITAKQEDVTKLKKMSFRDWVAGRTAKNVKGTDSGRELERRLLELEDEYKKKMARLKGGAFHYNLRKLNLKSLAKEGGFNL